MKQYKIRAFSKSKNSPIIKYGITIPNNITTFYPKETYFKIEMMGNGSLILLSGTLIKPTEQEIKQYKFENIRV